MYGHIADPVAIIKAMKQAVRYQHCNLATMQQGAQPFGLVKDAAVVVEGERTAWCGPQAELPGDYANLEAVDLEGRLVTPVLIDCHSHLVYGGDRASEFEMRLHGATYEAIAKQGGGIMATVNATRAAGTDELLAAALARVDALLDEGVGVIEVKSGYGLTIDDEIRLLRIARKLAELRPVRIKTTWLAAHTVPQEYAGRADAYIDDVVIPGLIRADAKGLVDAVDGFCEPIAFSPEQIERVFKAAGELSLPVKLHAEQLSDQKGALLAARYQALSADHLEYLAKEDVPAFAESGAVAVLLPGAFYFLNESQRPPIGQLRRHGVPMAVATDCNPGSSPVSSILTVMNMACTLFGLTPEEALAGTTRNAAAALGLAGEFGVIAPGAMAEFAVWDRRHPATLSYEIGAKPHYRTLSHRVHK